MTRRNSFQAMGTSIYRGRCYEFMTTNLFEVFNSVLKGVRNLPITEFVLLIV